MSSSAPRIVVSRTDRIGDVVLTLPLCAMLRARLGAEVVFLGRRYTAPVLEASEVVDRVVDWDAVPPSRAMRRDALAALQADAIVHAFPDRTIAVAAHDARIPLRIGTSHRWFHWLTCNAFEHFSRRRSALHEAQLNVRLARRLLGEAIPSLGELAEGPRLHPRVPLPADVATLIDPARRNLVLHPRSRGSAREWPLERWTALVSRLDAARYRLLVTGSAAERDMLQQWLDSLPAHVIDLTGRLTLPELIALFAAVDGLVAASTGPLHLAAATGTHALGLFPPTPPIHPGRWAPLGPRAEHLTAAAPCDRCARGGSGDCRCMEAISVDEVVARIARWDD